MSDAIEQWRPVVGYEGRYSISDRGRVYSLLTDKILRQANAHAGHKTVSLRPFVNGSGAQFVHKLVLEAFVGPAPDGLVCRHLNGDPADNRLENLCWGTRKENGEDASRHGTLGNARKTHCPQGHAYSTENTRVWRGRRYCRTCQINRAREWRPKRRQRHAG
jgi:hypothetical protein